MRTYDKYKDTGVGWIGEIPESWEFVSLRRITQDHKQGYYLAEGYIEEGCKLIRISDLSVNGYISYETAPSTFISPSDYEIFNLKVNDFLFPRTGSIGLLGFVQEDVYAAFASYLIRFRFSTLVEPHYLKYYFVSVCFMEGIYSELHGGVNQNIHAENIKNQFVPIPPLSEQTAIANYLDAKTTEIDQTIADKAALIILFEEEKKALINEVVTKGLNPNVKLKPSDIDWLGDIPEHWEVKKLKYLGIIKYGLGQPPKEKEDGLPLIRATNVERGLINEKNLIFVDPDDVPYERDPVLKENDIIVVRSGAYTADSAIIPKKFKGAITGYDMVFRPVKVIPHFIAYCFLSNYVLNIQLIPVTIRAAQPHLNREELGDTFIFFPPVGEQSAIVQYLNTAILDINEKVDLVKKEIELLKEYRQVLIFEAVTGKIKVD